MKKCLIILLIIAIAYGFANETHLDEFRGKLQKHWLDLMVFNRDISCYITDNIGVNNDKVEYGFLIRDRVNDCLDALSICEDYTYIFAAIIHQEDKDTLARLLNNYKSALVKDPFETTLEYFTTDKSCQEFFTDISIFLDIKLSDLVEIIEETQADLQSFNFE
jgi:hypothetical protein